MAEDEGMQHHRHEASVTATAKMSDAELRVHALHAAVNLHRREDVGPAAVSPGLVVSSATHFYRWLAYLDDETAGA